jgi:hypothetical protein
LKPRDKILVGFSGSREVSKILERNKERVVKEARILELKKREGKFDLEKEIKVDDQKIILAIKKVNGKSSTPKRTKAQGSRKA